MIDITVYCGPGQFGEAYRIMCENDVHARCSVDWVLGENMIRLCQDTAEYLYKEYTPERSGYRQGTRPMLEKHVKKIVSSCCSDEEFVEKIVLFTSSLRDTSDLDSMQFGGTEEEIIARGSEWCTDVVRVGCALCQVAGLPSRIVYLFDETKAYHGHVIAEVYRSSAWGAVDFVTNVIYRDGGKPASSWELMNSPKLIEKHWRGDSTYYTTATQFSRVAITNYFVWNWKEYDYTVSRVNEYYRSILEMSEKAWPGGFRWLHGEED
jgi:hypothetical protein